MSRCVQFAAAHRKPVKAAVEALHEEQTQHAPWRASAIDAAMTALFVALGRSLPPAAAAPGVGDRSVAHVQRFRALVDERFRDQPTLGDFAAEIGITTTQLNRVCRAVLGHPALAVLHARLCLEAQRELAYTTLSIKHIAYKLGFTDAGYFTRFFERETGSGAVGLAGRGARSAMNRQRSAETLRSNMNLRRRIVAVWPGLLAVRLRDRARGHDRQLRPRMPASSRATWSCRPSQLRRVRRVQRRPGLRGRGARRAGRDGGQRGHLGLDRGRRQRRLLGRAARELPRPAPPAS